MYYTVSRDRIPTLEIALKKLNIDYYSKAIHPAVFDRKWGTHKFNKRNESKIKDYFIGIGGITITGHSIY
jgi:hypothetical protein